MTTPKVPLSELSRKSAVKPWAADIKEAIDDFAAGKDGDEKSAEQGLKLLACVFKGAVRDGHADVRSDIEAAIQSQDWTLAANHLEEFQEALRTALRRIHKVGERSDKHGVSRLLRESWRAIDEYASLLAEESITDLVSLCSPHTNFSDVEAAVKSLQDMAIEQYQHRRDQGFGSYARDDEHNEYLPHRWRVLKRYVSSALYLDASANKTGTIARDLIAMFAAAMAMLFAASATVIIMKTWAASLSTAFIAAMVVSYVIKDRIKDFGKRFLGRQLNRYIADNVVSIKGADDAQVGTAQESFHIRPRERCDKELQQIRLAGFDSHEAIEGRPEHVLCYRKEVVLDSKELTNQFAGAEGLTDILRLNFQPFLSHMDDNWETYRYIHPDTRELCETKCARVYHINVVLRLYSQDALVGRHRVRAVVNKKGILRLEEVGSNERTYLRDVSEDTDSPDIRMFDE